MENFELTEIIVDPQPEGSYFYTDYSQGFGMQIAAKASRQGPAGALTVDAYTFHALIIALQKGEY